MVITGHSPALFVASNLREPITDASVIAALELDIGTLPKVRPVRWSRASSSCRRRSSAKRRRMGGICHWPICAIRPRVRAVPPLEQRVFGASDSGWICRQDDPDLADLRVHRRRHQFRQRHPHPQSRAAADSRVLDATCEADVRQRQRHPRSRPRAQSGLRPPHRYPHRQAGPVLHRDRSGADRGADQLRLHRDRGPGGHHRRRQRRRQRPCT